MFNSFIGDLLLECYSILSLDIAYKCWRLYCHKSEDQ